MYLKSVEICGFKSFGERVKIDFNRGITSIVGPNGSGKSNILDGILWVLGEQSYKNIRAKESKDILFSGGSGKKSSKNAQVSLYIDNRDRFFPIDVQDIKITRKIDVNGNNEYLLNDKRTRLKDIGELFLDTGVGKSAYSVIGQGKVEKIISASNKEIKSIIEEAAGVKKFQQKKFESEKRLENVQNEFEKIEIILNETLKNKEKVEKQSKKALKYLSLKDEKDELKKQLYLVEIQIYKKALIELKKNIQQFNIKNDKLENDIHNLEKNIKISEDKKEKLYKDIDFFSDNNNILKNEIDNLEKDEIRIKERILSYEREIVQTKKESDSIFNDIELKSKLLNELSNENENVKEKLLRFEIQNKKFEQIIDEKESLKKDKEVGVSLKKKKIMDLEVEKLKLLNEIESSDKRIKGSSYKVASLKEEFIEFEQKISIIQKKLLETSDIKNKKQIQLKKTEERQLILEKNITDISQNLNKIMELIRKSEFEEKRAVAKLQSLYRIQENNEGFYRGVKEVLNANIDGVEGAVISLISVPEKYQKAIEAGIPGNLQDIIVTTSSVAKQGIELLKRRKVGRASFLALDTIKIVKQKQIPNRTGVIGRASDVVECDEKYQKVLRMLLGNILIVENLEIGLEIVKKEEYQGNIVTISGELLSSRGRITGGESSNSIVSQLFERKKEIEELKIKVDSLSKNLISYNENANRMNIELEKMENEISGIDGVEDLLRKEIRIADELYLDLKNRNERLEKERKVIKIEIQEEENYNKEYKKRIENSESEREIMEKMIRELKSELDSELIEIQKLDGKINNVKNEFSDVRILYLNSKDRTQQIEKEFNREGKLKEELTQKKSIIKNQIENLKKELEKLEKKVDTILKDKNIKIKKYEDKNIKLKEMRKEERNLDEKLKIYVSNLRNIESILFEKKEILNKILEEKEQTIKKIDEIEIGLDKLKSIKIELNKNINLDESKKKISDLENKLKNFDTVNLYSIEEYKELNKKYNHINVQKEDLIKSRKSLIQLLKEIETTIQSKFYEAYKQIDKNFNEMCLQTLDNSEGRLTLHNEENFESCGVEISVKYKNKKRQALSLLSGGEKSMVAIAFIMAIFMYKPSPFAFLDEIEAALDEKNTRKLISKLKEFTKSSQFILITHNKETMKSSDTLYGVTMNKKIGISKLVSVKI